jgi:hypothetical protein
MDVTEDGMKMDLRETGCGGVGGGGGVDSTGSG